VKSTSTSTSASATKPAATSSSSAGAAPAGVIAAGVMGAVGFLGLALALYIDLWRGRADVMHGVGVLGYFDGDLWRRGM
jgi:hypothetical protein